MSAPVSATTMSAVYPPMPGMVQIRSRKLRKGLDHHLDSIGELLYRRGKLVDQVQVHAGQKRVMGGEPAVESLGQLRDFHPHPFSGQAGPWPPDHSGRQSGLR
jgi:hypothetical protein